MANATAHVVTAPVYDRAISSLNGSGAKKSTGFFGAIKGFFGRVFGAIKKAATRVFGAVKNVVDRVVAPVKGFLGRMASKLPDAVRRLGKPFMLLPLAVPRVWAAFGKIATWVYNHGPRQINNVLTRYIRAPFQRWINRLTTNSVFRNIPMVAELAGIGLLHRFLRGLGPWGWVASTVVVVFATDALKYASDFTDDNPYGQNVMAGMGLATTATLFIATLMGKPISNVTGLRFLTLGAAPVGGLVFEAFLGAQDDDDEVEDVTAESEVVEVTPEEMGEKVASDLRKDPTMGVTLIMSKSNPHPKGRKEVWVPKGADVDVEAVDGFFWRDGIGYDGDNNPVAVDLRGDLTRTTRDRRRQDFSAAWLGRAA